MIDWRIDDPAEVLAAVDKNLAELEVIISDATAAQGMYLVVCSDFIEWDS